MLARSVILASLLAATIASIVFAETLDDYPVRWYETEQQRNYRLWQAAKYPLLSQSSDTFWQAMAAYQTQHYAQAVSLFEQVGAKDPRKLEALFNQSLALAQMQQYQAAINTLDDFLYAKPGHSAAKANRKVLLALLNSRSTKNEEQSDPDISNSQSKQSQVSDEVGNRESSELRQADKAEAAQQTGKPSQADDAGQSASRNESLADAIQNTGTSSSAPVSAVAANQSITQQEQQQQQLLQQIEDDPTGLLKRKLELNHRRRYPDVRRNGRGV